MVHNIIAIVQARMGSTRLPGKVLMQIKGKSLIEILLNRLAKSKNIDKIVLATSNNQENIKLIKHVETLGFSTFSGSEDDVLDRYYKVAKLYKASIVVRITGDCPLIDPHIVDELISKYIEDGMGYTSNIDPPTFPHGLDAEVFSFELLEYAKNKATTAYEKEHVTPFIRNSIMPIKSSLKFNVDYSNERWTVDYNDDFSVIKEIVNHFYPNIFFSWLDVIKLKKQNSKIFKYNKHIKTR